jgi:hypothetical protein
MTDHFNGVHMGVNFAPMGKNWFHVTLFSEGDYEFVARGGSWIYRGYPLLVAKIPEVKWPSETVLNSVPLWVQVYDLPWNRQKKTTALLVGAKLGKYLEADLVRMAIVLMIFCVFEWTFQWTKGFVQLSQHK